MAASPSIMRVVTDLVTSYKKDTPASLMLVDSFIAYAVVVALVQFAYCMLVGTFPFNSFLSGFLAAMGVLCLTVSLRMQHADKDTFGGRTRYQAFAEYIIGCTVLFLAVLNFMG